LATQRRTPGFSEEGQGRSENKTFVIRRHALHRIMLYRA
jgi:hypothetical protein